MFVQNGEVDLIRNVLYFTQCTGKRSSRSRVRDVYHPGHFPTLVRYLQDLRVTLDLPRLRNHLVPGLPVRPTPEEVVERTRGGSMGSRDRVTPKTFVRSGSASTTTSFSVSQHVFGLMRLSQDGGYFSFSVRAGEPFLEIRFPGPRPGHSLTRQSSGPVKDP